MKRVNLQGAGSVLKARRATGGVLVCVFQVLLVLFGCAPWTFAQSMMQSSGPGTRLIMFGGDQTVLDAREPRQDIPCKVTPEKPELGFDLKFHTHFDISVPMAELHGGEDILTMLFRVTPAARPDSPSYFIQRITVPKLDEQRGGEAYLGGSFISGEGEYQVDWLMRDRSERVCSSYWTSTAVLSAKDRLVHVAVAPGAVEATDPEPFREEPPISRDPGNGVNVKVLVNFAPQRFLASSLQPIDTAALVSILRNISREPRIGKFSIVAFNMQEQRIVYRQDQADRIDFPALGSSLNKLKLGTVDVAHLNQKHSDTEFLTSLITTEMAKDHPDAVIFAGPKVMTEEQVSVDSLKAISNDVSFPVFYMNYILNPNANPWRDAIGNVVKKLRGYEYTISRPHDLWNAWTEIMSHIVKSRVARVASLTPATR